MARLQSPSFRGHARRGKREGDLWRPLATQPARMDPQEGLE